MQKTFIFDGIQAQITQLLDCLNSLGLWLLQQQYGNLYTVSTTTDVSTPEGQVGVIGGNGNNKIKSLQLAPYQEQDQHNENW